MVFEEFMVSLGHRMRQIRERRGINQTELARLIDVSKQTVSQWELGRMPPQLINIIRFAKVMSVDPTELLRGLDDTIGESDKSVRRLRVTECIVPVYANEDDALGAVCEGTKKEPIRFFAADRRHTNKDFAFEITTRSMLDKFKLGDIVSIIQKADPEPGQFVFAKAGDQGVFRRYIPTKAGTHVGARLLALNSMFPELTMGEADSIIGVMGSHSSIVHD
jgi:transcriptional regulator with XRE-family HTH domain